MFSSFHRRLLLLVVGLVVTAQITSFVAVLGTVDREVNMRIQTDLVEGSMMLEHLVRKRGDSLLNSAQVLAADFGFKSAIASGDRQTILSALRNNQARIEAELSMLIDLDGTVVAGTSSHTKERFRYRQLADAAKESEALEGIVALGGQPRQVVIVPIKAPVTIAWLLLGFALDDQLAEALARQTGTQVSFAARTAGGLRYSGSTLPTSLRAGFPEVPLESGRSGQAMTVSLAGETFLRHAIVLDAPSGEISAILHQSLDAAMQSYRELRNRLIGVASVSLAAAVLLALWLARGVTRPVQRLSQAAQRIRDGDYQTPLDMSGKDEFSELANTFNHMQAGIADREKRIVHQGLHDELTQLPNLRLARDRLQQQLHAAEHANEKVAVIVIGVNRLKQVIDTWGHPIGDQLLRDLAGRLSVHTHRGHAIARIADGEFALIVGNSDAATVRSVAKAIRASLSVAVTLEAAEVIPDITCGISLFPDHGARAGDLLRRAGLSLADARERQLPLLIYEEGRDETYRRQLSLVSDLKRAVDEDQLIMHYQPKISMADCRVRSVEALVRWIHPEHGFMPPGEFIRLAETSGNISMLSNWILQSVIQQVAQWRAAGIDLVAAVNLSAMDLQDAFLLERILGYLSAQGLKPTDLIIEVTESAMMQDADTALALLARMRDEGLGVSIDDFGTGYSSLAKLRDLPINELKIDRSFIIDIQPGSTDALIVKAIIDLGHGMNLKITTEGVETVDEWNLLAELGSDTVQGYYVSRPLPPEDFQRWWAGYHDSDRFESAA